MSKFKVGDKVTLSSVDRYAFRDVDHMKQLFGRTLVVRSVHYDQFTPVVFAGVPGDVCWNWYPDDLRLVSEAQPKPAPQKPVLRGDLVEFNGSICVVISEGPDRGGDYWIASLTEKPDCYWANTDEFARVSSIRKKVKRIKKAMEGVK